MVDAHPLESLNSNQPPEKRSGRLAQTLYNPESASSWKSADRLMPVKDDFEVVGTLAGSNRPHVKPGGGHNSGNGERDRHIDQGGQQTGLRTPGDKPVTTAIDHDNVSQDSPAVKTARNALREAMQKPDETQNVKKALADLASALGPRAPNGWKSALDSLNPDDLKGIIEIAKQCNVLLSEAKNHDASAIKAQLGKVMQSMSDFSIKGSPETWVNAAPIIDLMTGRNDAATSYHLDEHPFDGRSSGSYTRFLDLNFGNDIKGLSAQGRWQTNRQWRDPEQPELGLKGIEWSVKQAIKRVESQFWELINLGDPR